MARVFLTGASGFLGRKVSSTLVRRGHDVTSLVRHSGAVAGAVIGDLCAPSTYEAALAGVDVVVHLAAITGRAQDADYTRVNVDGTRILVEAARQAGIPRFLFCSTIAVSFPDIRHYPYARSKVAGEDLVRQSGLRTTTIRPTILAGPGSPVLSKLAALARLPVVPAFGGGHAWVQPILVDDAAELIVDIVELDRFEGETLDMGGRDVLTLRDLLDRLHRRGGERPPLFLPIPIGLLAAPLRLLEPLLGPALPLTIGQLTTFRYDGVAQPNAVWNGRFDRLSSLDAVLDLAPDPPTDELTRLTRECQTFTKLLTGRAPTTYVEDQYLRAHRARTELSAHTPFDATLVARASTSPLMARLADGYARRVLPRGLLRQKLIFLLAILETAPGTHTVRDASQRRSMAGAMAGLVLNGVTGVVVVLAGLVLFGTMRLLGRRSS
jgi:nucleoside-diphosphate-sugar epimerase